jgi:26S proteasome regulatory subunit N5
MIQYALHNASYLDAAKHYYKVWETPSIKAETEGRGKTVCGPAFVTAVI